MCRHSGAKRMRKFRGAGIAAVPQIEAAVHQHLHRPGTQGLIRTARQCTAFRHQAAAMLVEIKFVAMFSPIAIEPFHRRLQFERLSSQRGTVSCLSAVAHIPLVARMSILADSETRDEISISSRVNARNQLELTSRSSLRVIRAFF